MTRTISILVSAVIVALFVTIGSGYAFKENIVVAWLMEEGAGKKVADSTGNHKDGEIVGKAEWVDGKFGKALRFDGSTTYVQIPFNPDFQVLNEGDITFAAWFKTEVLPAERGSYIAGFQQMDLNGIGRNWLALGPNSGATDETYSYLGNGFALAVPPEVGEWYHFALVAKEEGDVDTLQAYSNGKPEMDSVALGIETCEGDYLIGCHKAKTPLNFWEGIIDEVVIINKALTEAQISELMNKGVSGVLAVEGKDKLTTTWGVLKSGQ